jgi:hypothetical protein
MLQKSLIFLQSFLNDPTQDQDFCKSIHQSLSQIQKDAQKKQLRIVTASQSFVLLTAFTNLMKKNSQLNSVYQVTPLLPLQPPQKKSILTLLLPTNNQQSINHQQTLVIGREINNPSSNNLIYLQFPEKQRLSQKHIEIFYQQNNWIIKDLNSKNGTFVNGNKVTQESIIKNGDKISLAYPRENEKGLTFTVTIEEENQEIEKTWESVIIADIACLLIDPFQSLSIIEQQWINYIMKMPVLNLFMIFDITKFNPSNVNQANQNIANIENLINQKFSKYQKIIKKIRLNLAPYYPKANSNSIPPSVQHLINNFCKPLVLLSQVNLDQLIEQQLQKKIMLLVKKIQYYNLSQLHLVQKSMREVEQNLANLQTNLKQSNRNLRDDREEFANSIRLLISNEKTKVSSSFVPDSILGKMALHHCGMIYNKGETFTQAIADR